MGAKSLEQTRRQKSTEITALDVLRRRSSFRAILSAFTIAAGPRCFLLQRRQPFLADQHNQPFATGDARVKKLTLRLLR